MVSTSTGAMVKNFFKIEGSLLSLFSSIAVATISLADKTAMTDQQYRLFGMRMLMTKDSARAMQISMDELGASLDEIAYDPELNKRFQYLYEQNIKLGKTLGENFNSNMTAIRGLRTEFKFFGTELEMLASGAISKLFEKMGYGSGDLLHTLDQISDRFIEEIPHWSDSISSFFLPVWNESVLVVKDFGSMAKIAAGEFTYLTGVLTGDQSIQDTTFSVKNLVKALGDWLDKLTQIALFTGLVTKTALHFGGAVTSGAYDLMLRGPFMAGGSKEELEARAQANKEASAVTDNLHSLFTGQVYGNPDFDAIIQYTEGTTPGSTKKSQVPGSLQSVMSNPDFLRLLHGIAMTESSNRQFDINGRPITGQPNPTGELAVGRFQILPSTAKKYHIDPTDDTQNTIGGAMILRDLLNKYHGDVRKALADYGGFHHADPTDYINKVEKFGFNSGYTPGGAGDVIIQNLNIHVPHDLPKEDWYQFVKKSMHDLKITDIRNITAQTAGGAFY